MKRTVELTPHQSETWLAVLSVFDASIVNEAVLKIGLSDDPFPDLGKLVTRCDAIRRERSGTVGVAETRTLSTAMLRRVSAALQLPIE